MTTAQPTGEFTLERVRALLGRLPPEDAAARAAAAARNAELTKPTGALGRLEEIAQWLAAWQGTPTPTVAAPAVAVFAANHGVTKHGVSPYPAEVTAQMVANFAAGGAAINHICAAAGIRLDVHPIALAQPTGDIMAEPAMGEADCVHHIALGMSAVPDHCDLFAAGDMGIGNTTSAAAVYVALFGGDAARVVGRGTGVDNVGLHRKIDVVQSAVANHANVLGDPLQVLRCLGGREIAAIMGAILAARFRRIPVVLDGYVVTAAASVLHAMNPDALAHCVAGHASAEGAHAQILERLGLKPVLSLGMRLGEGTGAALAMSVVKAAAACQSGMATFATAGVANK
jgi:nicotinate-nucleotide--dimethylbenzimidazole phosphoribosyltransferase